MPAASLAEMEEMVRAARAGLPAPFQAYAREVAVQIQDWPDQATLDALGISNPLDLTGLYEGTPLTEKFISDPAPFPDMIWLFREPILAELKDRNTVSLQSLVRHVYVHELAHHFGWSDEDIAVIDPWWE